MDEHRKDKDEKEFDRILKEKLKDRASEAPADLWDNIQHRIGPDRRKNLLEHVAERKWEKSPLVTTSR